MAQQCCFHEKIATRSTSTSLNLAKASRGDRKISVWRIAAQRGQQRRRVIGVNFRRNGARDFRRNGATEKHRN
jgi:hypothetical protein